MGGVLYKIIPKKKYAKCTRIPAQFLDPANHLQRFLVNHFYGAQRYSVYVKATNNLLGIEIATAASTPSMQRADGFLLGGLRQVGNKKRGKKGKNPT